MPYTYFRSLTADHTLCGSTTDSTDFPVLVSLSDPTLKTIANGGHVTSASGFDIGFFDSSSATTPLFWEVEFYDPVNGILVAWVKIPTLSHTTDTVFYMFYGDASITSFQSTASSVWNSGYKAVWHFGDGTTLNCNDSTTNANNATAGNGLGGVIPVAGAGQIDGGAFFAHTGTAPRFQQIDAGGASSMNPSAITISAWVNAANLPSDFSAVITRLQSGSFPFAYFLSIKSNGKLGVFINASSSINDDGLGSHTLSTGNWYWLTLTYDSSAGLAVYVNNASDYTAAANGALSSNSHSTLIGADQTTARGFDGTLDEVRISDTVRSTDWLTCEYNSQNAPGSFLALGAEQNTDTRPAANGVGWPTCVVAPIPSTAAAAGVGWPTGRSATGGQARGIGWPTASSIGVIPPTCIGVGWPTGESAPIAGQQPVCITPGKPAPFGSGNAGEPVIF